jgi:hypothetical protein
MSAHRCRSSIEPCSARQSLGGFVIDKLQEAVASLFMAVLKVSAGHHGAFRLMVTVEIDGEEKPLLVVGNAHKDVEDGHAIGVLNPTRELAQGSRVAAGTAYPADLLKEIVAGQCDAMVEIWVDAYKNNKVSRLSSYKSRTPQHARLEIR